MDSTIITRFAPSPTGQLHIGGLRTALYAYLFARAHEGKFLLRIEDTDRSRYVEGAEESLQKALLWAGLSWDNEKMVRQSDRLEVYKKYVQILLDEGKAYHCFCSPERLTQMRLEQQKKKEAPKYDRTCAMLSQEEALQKKENGESCVVRFRIPEEASQLEFRDAIRGKIGMNTHLIDDQIIMKSDGFPTYHLASVVDDYESNVTHVIRGEEWLSSTPKHILLYKAFGWDIPVFAHLPLLLNADRSKLSKRQGDVSVEEYKEKGYLPEALVNYVALLGWNPGGGSTKEFFFLSELEKQFNLKDINKAGAVFDPKRLDWISAHYIKEMSDEDLLEKTRPFWKDLFEEKGISGEKYDDEFLKKVLSIEKSRLAKLSDVGRENIFFFLSIEVEKEMLRFKEMSDESVVENLTKAQNALEKIALEDWTQETLGKTLLETCDENAKGEFFWPLRVALTGEKKSPPPHEVAWVIGKEKTLERIQRARKLFSP